MSFPILYAADDTKFDGNGIGILTDCISCEVTEERNGAFELAMTYPVGGIHWDKIARRAVIMAKPDPYRTWQYFRIYSISKPMSGVVKVSAEHISYGLSGFPIMPFSAESASDAMRTLYSNVATYETYQFYAQNFTTSDEAHFETFVPKSARAVVEEILSLYGGELEFDNRVVRLYNVLTTSSGQEYSGRGADRGVTIAYGKNLIDLKQEENCASVYTGIMPYWNAEEGVNLITLPERIVNAKGDFGFTKIKVVDFSSDFEVEPTEDELREAAEKYIKEYEIGVPTVSLTVSFAQLKQYDEYKDANFSDRVSLCDTVTVKFTAMGIEKKAKVVKLVYDVLANRVKTATIGSVKNTVFDTLSGLTREAKKPEKFYKHNTKGETIIETNTPL